MAAGLAVQLVRHLPGTDAVGSVLYAIAAVFSLRVVWPSRETPRPLAVAGVALALCVFVELAQLTGLPARVSQLRLVLGTTFAPVDLLWYAVGALGGAGAMVLVRRLRP
ncbi:DUF2809 domain-containing protein [Janibacter indicus]|uniref:ribosomal maturation YjgA family protein n=1 Tax=Janibacter indicus TaxID=857417 RepID=UPI003D9A9146